MIYLDHAATTKVDPDVFAAMEPFLQQEYGNPSSFYGLGQRASQAVEQARETIADYIGADAREIIFTGCGSEADNYAVKGAAWALRDEGRHIITSSIEHHAVLHACEALEKDGYDVTYLPVDKQGLVNPADVEAAIGDDTILVTVMHSNNEVGTIEPVDEIGAICRERGVLFHSDAVQSLGKLPIDVDELPADMLSFSGHKVYAPKGVGVLYVRRGTKLRNLIDGGGQEFGKRAGTENVAGIVGFGKAVELLRERAQADNRRITELRDTLISGITDSIPDVIVTGHRQRRLPHIASFCIRYIEGEGILLSLDQEDICASSGSACTSGSLEASHVLLAMGYDHETAHGSLRLSLGRENTEEEIETVIDALGRIVKRLRDMSPLWSDTKGGADGG